MTFIRSKRGPDETDLWGMLVRAAPFIHVLIGPEKLHIEVISKNSENLYGTNHLVIGQLAIYSHGFAPNAEKGRIVTKIFLFLRTNT